MGKVLVFVLSILLLASPVMAQKKPTAKEMLKKKVTQLNTKQQELDAEKSKSEKLQKENEELQKKMNAGSATKPQEKMSWWTSDAKKDCIGWSSFLSSLGGGAIGYGIGSNDHGAQIAGSAIILAILIAPSDSSDRCTISGALIGGGIAYEGGLRNRQRIKEHKQTTESTVTTGNTTSTGGTGAGTTTTTVTTGGTGTTNSTVSTGGTGTTPGNGLPPPPPGAPALKAEIFPIRGSEISIIPVQSKGKIEPAIWINVPVLKF